MLFICGRCLRCADLRPHSHTSDTHIVTGQRYHGGTGRLLLSAGTMGLVNLLSAGTMGLVNLLSVGTRGLVTLLSVGPRVLVTLLFVDTRGLVTLLSAGTRGLVILLCHMLLTSEGTCQE